MDRVLIPETAILVKSDGTRSEIEVQFSSDSVLTFDTSTHIEVDDIFERILPNGARELWCVTSANFTKRFHGIAEHYDCKIKRAKHQDTPKESVSMKIFVSHSAKDECLAVSMVQFLINSMVLDDDDVRCTSVPGHKLAIGVDTAVAIRKELNASTPFIVIGLITPNSLQSGWVLFELGVAWARECLKLTLADGAEFKDLPGPLSGSNAIRLSSVSDLIQLANELSSAIGTKLRKPEKVHLAAEGLKKTHDAWAENQKKTRAT